MKFSWLGMIQTGLVLTGGVIHSSRVIGNVCSNLPCKDASLIYVSLPLISDFIVTG